MSKLSMMMTPFQKDLLTHFPAAHPEFLAELERQLVPAFEAKVKVPFTGYNGIQPIELGGPFQVKTKDGMTWVDFYLIWMGFGGVSRLVWDCPGQSDPVPMAAGPPTGIRFWWDHLDVEGFRERHTWYQQTPPNPLAGRFAYPVRWEIRRGLDWEVTLTGPSGKAKTLTDLLYARQHVYNDPDQNDRFGGIIHNLGEVTEPDPGRYRWTMDAGSAGHEGLAFLLEGLDFVPGEVVIEEWGE